MSRWLPRLLIIGLILAAAAFVASRLLNPEEDFDDYDDIDSGLEFTETPVEIDIPIGDASGGSATAQAPTSAISSGMSAEPDREPDRKPSPASFEAQEPQAGGSEDGHYSLLDITGIGPTYAARLSDVGVTSLDELAKADPDALVEQIEVIGGRATIENWIMQAQSLISGSDHTGQYEEQGS